MIFLETYNKFDYDKFIDYDKWYNCLYDDNIECIMEYINKGVDVNKKSYDGVVPVHICYDEVEILKILVDAGADLDLRDIDGNTALILAGFFNNMDSVKFLLDNDANPILQDIDKEIFYDFLTDRNKEIIKEKYPEVYDKIKKKKLIKKFKI